MSRTRVGVLISGRGSNMQALIRAAEDPAFPAEIGLVISNRPDAAGLDFAAAAGIDAIALDHTAFGEDRAAHERAVDAKLREAGVEALAYAGYMRIQTPWFIQTWLGRSINIHPSLLPLFKGLHPQRQALGAGVKLSGCTVHEVTLEVDSGPIIGQAAVPVLPGDTEETLAARILVAEHRLYPACLAAFVRGEAVPAVDAAGLFNPAC
jgi:formyltetrahydrofolate-dependent phosphoribosylglycinamide formyltransferase